MPNFATEIRGNTLTLLQIAPGRHRKFRAAVALCVVTHRERTVGKLQILQFQPRLFLHHLRPMLSETESLASKKN